MYLLCTFSEISYKILLSKIIKHCYVNAMFLNYNLSRKFKLERITKDGFN
jgi:hypothetical protein